MTTDVLVIGGGMAGMVAALRAAQAGARVTLLARTPPGTECNSAVSGGGLLIAGPNLSVAEHSALTMDVGHGINDPDLVEVLTRQAPACREWLEATTRFPLNVKDKGQGYWSTGGGAGLSARLAEAVCRSEGITVRTALVSRLLVQDGVCYGALVEAGVERQPLFASATVLATGGYAGLFARHDNPGAPYGSGVVMAARAGARLRDLEFVQFYPVATAEPGLPTFMLFRPFPPEARLVTEDGRDLLDEAFGGRSLNDVAGAARDDLSQIIHAENRTGQVYFDATRFDWSQVNRWFAMQHISQYRFDWQRRRARVAPIAHHAMGGVWIDRHARTNIGRLYAAGEAASGVHGANRHGSNSLTDCLVFGSTAGLEAAGELLTEPPASMVPGAEVLPSLDAADFATLQDICWQYAGLVRDADSLAEAQRRLAKLPPSAALLMAKWMIAFARRRTESRGAHSRADYPAERPEWRKSQTARLVDGRLRFED